MFDKQAKLINEKRNLTQKYISDLYWEYDRMSSSGQETLDKLATLYNIETNQELEERLAKMSKEDLDFYFTKMSKEEEKS